MLYITRDQELVIFFYSEHIPDISTRNLELANCFLAAGIFFTKERGNRIGIDRFLFGENLHKVRRKKGYTQAELSRLSGISQRMIGHYETKVKRPSIEKVKILAEVLGVSDEELLWISKKSKKSQEDDVSYRIMKKVRVIETLPVRDQKAIFRHINTLVERNRFRDELKKKEGK